MACRCGIQLPLGQRRASLLWARRRQRVSSTPTPAHASAVGERLLSREQHEAVDWPASLPSEAPLCSVQKDLRCVCACAPPRRIAKGPTLTQRLTMRRPTLPTVLNSTLTRLHNADICLALSFLQKPSHPQLSAPRTLVGFSERSTMLDTSEVDATASEACAAVASEHVKDALTSLQPDIVMFRSL